MTPFVGQISLFAGNFAPAGWLFCDGSLVSISEYETLFQLIGTTYGGDGQSTFALPDLRGRIPIHMGNGFVIGEMGGAAQVTLTTNQIPAHTHVVLGPSLQAYGANAGNQSVPQGNYPAITPGENIYSSVKREGVFLQDPQGYDPNTAFGQTGGSQPHENQQPYLAVNFIISLFGIFPSPT
ncbi:tail fiber protein [Algoriphagus sp.]|uniref:phage tail protein n=1 Tax=Algoriphagus sp. TaxID=1872435 RepID=UPI0026149400|nr:tail fiber protein [Algoriphagus sp.]